MKTVKIEKFVKKNEAEILSSKKKIKRTFCRKSSQPSLIHILSLSSCMSTSSDASYFKLSFTCMQQFLFSPSFTSHRQRFFFLNKPVFFETLCALILHALEKLRALSNSVRFQTLCFSNAVFS